MPERAPRATRPVGEATRRYLAAKAERHRAGASVSPLLEAHERDVWTAIQDALVAYHAPLNWCDARPVEALSPEMVATIADALGELLTRGAPETWDVIRGKARALSPADVGDISDGVRYILVARDGVISDRSAPRTVALAFGVNRRTVNRWLTNAAYVPAPLPECGDADPELVKLTMAKSGARYRART